MLSRKLYDLAEGLDLRLDLAAGPVDRALVEMARNLLRVYAEDVARLEAQTVPLSARRVAAARRQAGNLGSLGHDDNVVDIDEFRDRLRPVAGRGGAA